MSTRPTGLADQRYWEEKYQGTEEVREWYMGFTNLKSLLLPRIPRGGNVCEIGCGNSQVLEEFVHHRPDCTAIGVDASVAAMEYMHSRRGTDRLAYVVMDVRRLGFTDACFDTVIDKALIDTVVCARIPSQVTSLIREVHRILRPGGTFVVVSYSNSRLELLQTSGVNWETPVLVKPVLSERIRGEHKKTYRYHVYMLVKASQAGG